MEAHAFGRFACAQVKMALLDGEHDDAIGNFEAEVSHANAHAHADATNGGWCQPPDTYVPEMVLSTTSTHKLSRGFCNIKEYNNMCLVALGHRKTQLSLTVGCVELNAAAPLNI